MKKYNLIIAILMATNIFGATKRDFCKFETDKTKSEIKNLTPSFFNLKDEKLILEYAPVAYLHKVETAFPMKVEEYFTGSHTAMKSKSKKEETIPKGKIRMEQIFKFHKLTKPEQSDYYFEIDDCVKKGSNVKENSDSKGNLTTPIYALLFEQNNKLYIQYLFFYGFNSPYSLRGLFSLAPDKYMANVRNAHEADLEHITIEFDPKTYKPERIYYGSHGRYEGFWLNWSDKDVEKENKTHPIVYVAKGGHGLYPKIGTWVRIFGFANDKANKGLKWIPNVRRIYKKDDKKFDPKTMGWLYHAGNYGAHGVGSAHNQSWFGDVTNDIGRDYSKAPYCPLKSDGKPDRTCAFKKSFSASLPK